MSAAPPAALPNAAPPATPPADTPPPAQYVKDQQTGKVYIKIEEHWYDKVSAAFSALYSLAVIGYLTFMILYMLSGKYAFWPEALTNKIANLLTYPVAKLILYTAIGGAMGAAVNNLRSFISWHAEDKAFGWRFIWKYLAMPPLGGTLAVLVYGILQGGMAVINGGATPENNQLTSLSAWATGTLAGYGSSKVFIWLDDKVNTLFKIDKKQVAVPNLIGKSEDDARQTLSNAQLEVGTVSKEEVTSNDQVDKVIKQSPAVATIIDCGSKVDLTIGIAKPATDPDPTIDPALKPEAKNGNGSSATDPTKATDSTDTTDKTENAETEEQPTEEQPAGEVTG
ncbi:MAG TPA: PASTA domain-containing protein [Pyrinomonadaceae bacterium]|nr:PASTA domain-containing protein [Pyrinomonadaceae bacterium]